MSAAPGRSLAAGDAVHVGAGFRDARVGGCVVATLVDRPDGSQVLSSTEPLQAYPERLTDVLEHWARTSPARPLLAQRDASGAWQHLSYADMLARAQAVGQALLDAGVSAERPLAILADNSLDHATLMMGAMWAGVPYASVSVAYALVSSDFARLRHILGVLTPGMVYAAHDGFGRAISALVPADVPVVLGRGELADRPTTPFATLLDTPPGPALAQAHAAVTADTIAKILFTSGSASAPKGVITTHRMLSANQQMLRQCMAFLADEPPVLLDWLPWSHTFGGSHNLGIALYNGGSLYIDDGKPTPTGFAQTVRNLKDVSPTVYFNVPKGLEELANAMDVDAELRDAFFRQLKAIMFAAAGLSQAVWDKLDRHAVAACGERVRVLTSLGMTETAPSGLFLVGTHARSGHVGLPCPGVEAKLVPVQGKLEVRFRGPNVMPGYWREPALTAKAFDAEGFYCTGDAVRFVDAEDLSLGLSFDGRIAEDFKLSTGTFVSVGPLRSRIVLEGHPYVQDAVLAGLNRDQVAALIFPRLADCRALAGLGPEAAAADVLHHPHVRERFQQLADRLYAQGTGSANRVERLHVLVEPPSVAHGEITDKNSINQRAVLSHRAALVDALYEGADADPWLIRPRKTSKELT
ncbi:feruloyl-CoA synthase [Roseateles sp. BYS78W]|uniref:Feruloyl-CoA synthase n=1 Tax=Pelomonas candidula TaxID=3299025 RepID=A0ABW7HJ67_9BURK